MVTPVGIVTKVILEQPRNACDPIDVILGQIIEVNEVNEEHPKKARSLIVITLLGMEVNEEHS